MKDRCGWCTNSRGKTETEFTVIDDNFVKYVPNNLINYCPFCGRYINRKKRKEPEWKGRMMKTFLGEEA